MSVGETIRGGASMECIADVAVEPSVRSAVAALREILQVEVAYSTRHTATDQILETIEGDSASFGVGEGAVIPLEATYCQRILVGELPSVMGDVRGHPVAGAMPMTEMARVGAFASVPLTLSDGTLYGTLCCGSHEHQDQWHESDVRLMRVIARIVADQLEREALQRELNRAQVQTTAIDALLSAVAARDGYTAEHSLSVVARATATARVLELPESLVADVEQVAWLHDVGKIGVPDAVLRKAGPLDEVGWELIRQHPVIGEQIVAAMQPLAHLALAIRAGHERWDGGGYPDGLAGEKIPIASRIVLACDAYDAMTSDRPYRSAMALDDARAELHRGAGTQLDPAVVAALLNVLER